MPIRIPDALPATQALERENIFVMTELRAMHQDIRPLKVAILNLMPTKIATETQIMRKLANTPLQIEITLLHTASHDAKNAPGNHMESFYRTFPEVNAEHFDGLIITGAPVDQLEFEDVDYWPELVEIMDWARTNVHSVLHICWGAFAGLYHYFGIEKHLLSEKVSGVFKHHMVKSSSPWVRGLDDEFSACHSRYAAISLDDIEAHPDLELIATSEEVGAYLVKSTDSRFFFVFGHPEYDRLTLKNEYERDLAAGIDPQVPKHYFPHDDPTQEPLNTWRAQGQLLYTNWLNYYVYQTTPYDVLHAGSPARGQDLADEVPLHELRDADGAVARAGAPAGRSRRASTFARAENEDDDGYDPWSDRDDDPPLFEADPWE